MQKREEESDDDEDEDDDGMEEEADSDFDDEEEEDEEGDDDMVCGADMWWESRVGAMMSFLVGSVLLGGGPWLALPVLAPSSSSS